MKSKIIISCLILIIVGAFGYFLLSQKSSPAITEQQVSENLPNTEQTSSQVNITEWKTYRNDKYGFEFKYPREWTVSAIDSGADVVFSTEKVDEINLYDFSVFVGPISGAQDGQDNITLDEYLVGYAYDKNYLRQDKNIGGIQMIRFESKSDWYGDNKEIRYIIVREKLMYEFVIHYINYINVTYFDKILSTFKFTK